jgi:hypothetical protein
MSRSPFNCCLPYSRERREEDCARHLWVANSGEVHNNGEVQYLARPSSAADGATSTDRNSWLDADRLSNGAQGLKVDFGMLQDTTIVYAGTWRRSLAPKTR